MDSPSGQAGKATFANAANMRHQLQTFVMDLNAMNSQMMNLGEKLTAFVALIVFFTIMDSERKKVEYLKNI